MHWTIKLFVVLLVVFNVDVPNSYAMQNNSNEKIQTNTPNK